MQENRTKSARINLTKSSIEAIELPTQDRCYVYDTKTPGLALCVTATGSKTFYVYRKLDGRPERIRIGPWPLVSVEEARRQTNKIVGKLASGENPNDRRRQDRASPTLAEAFETFINLPTRTKAKRPKSEKTVVAYRQQFAAYLINWHQRQLCAITRRDVETLQNELAEDVGHHTSNRVLALLKAVFNAAIDHGDLSVNPAARITGFEEVSRERFLQADELPRFFEALEAEPSEKIRDFVKLAIFTGQRRGNVLAMRWADLNLKRGLWSIPATKTGRHEVPLIPAAVEILRRRMEVHEGGEYVFPGRHGAEHLKDPMRQWREILKRAGIENLRIHDLRRTMGSWLAITGASLTIVGKTLGHSRPETTAIYSRLSDDPVRAAMQTAANAILKAVKNG